MSTPILHLPPVLAASRRERRTQGDWKFLNLWHPNRQHDAWHQNKDRR